MYFVFFCFVKKKHPENAFLIKKEFKRSPLRISVLCRCLSRAGPLTGQRCPRRGPCPSRPPLVWPGARRFQNAEPGDAIWSLRLNSPSVQCTSKEKQKPPLRVYQATGFCLGVCFVLFCFDSIPLKKIFTRSCGKPPCLSRHF